jgi:hypothetical protein
MQLQRLEVMEQSAQVQLTKLADIALSVTDAGHSCNIVKVPSSPHRPSPARPCHLFIFLKGML